LQYFNREDPGHVQGFRTIQTTDASHPYVSAWWPPGHIIGYEHTFVHQALDFLKGLKENKPLSPDFLEGARNQAVLEAMSGSARLHRWVRVPRVN